MDWAASTTPASTSLREVSTIRATKGAAEITRGTMAPLTPMAVPTTSRVKGMHGHHQDREGQGPADVDDPAQHAVEGPVGPDALGLGEDQGHPQGQADHIGEQGGDRRP